MKFNIGDRVQSISTKRRGTVRGISGCLVAVELDDQTSGVPIPKFGIAHGLFLMEEDYEKISTNKILITSDGKTTLARLYDGEKVTRSAETKCSPTDTYDFATGANLAYDRLMRPTSVEPQGKPKFKAGDKAKVTGNTSGHYFRMGEIVQLISFDDCACEPSWLARSTKNDSSWWIHERDMEPYTEPEKQEPVNLYCVKSCNNHITKGRVYEFDGHQVNYENLQCFYADDFDDWKRGDAAYSACLFSLARRPAKAGEWVLPLADCPFGRYEGNQLLKVTRDFSNKPDSVFYNRGVVYEHPDCNAYVIRNDEYLTLDGYDGRYEQTEPQYFSGKVVCVEAHCPLTNSFTAGKVYTFENGKVADNDGDARPLDDAMETLAGWNEEHGGIAKFIEYKGEAT